MMELTKSSKVLGVLVGIGAVLIALHWLGSGATAPTASSGVPPAHEETATLAATPSPAVAPSKAPGERPLRVALATWPGHMPLVIANGGLTTAAGSIAAAEGLNLEISFVDDPSAKNRGLQAGELDFIWHT